MCGPSAGSVKSSDGRSFGWVSRNSRIIRARVSTLAISSIGSRRTGARENLRHERFIRRISYYPFYDHRISPTFKCIRLRRTNSVMRGSLVRPTNVASAIERRGGRWGTREKNGRDPFVRAARLGASVSRVRHFWWRFKFSTGVKLRAWVRRFPFVMAEWDRRLPERASRVVSSGSKLRRECRTK